MPAQPDGGDMKEYIRPELKAKGNVSYGDLAAMDPKKENPEIQAKLNELRQKAEAVNLELRAMELARDTFGNVGDRGQRDSKIVSTELRRRAEDSGLDAAARAGVTNLRGVPDEETAAGVQAVESGELDGYLKNQLLAAAEKVEKEGVEWLKESPWEREEKSGKGMTAEEAVARVKAAREGASSKRDGETQSLAEDKGKWTLDRVLSAVATGALAMDEAQEFAEKFGIGKDVFSKMVKGVRETIWGKPEGEGKEEPQGDEQRVPTAAEIGAAVAEALRQQQVGRDEGAGKGPEPKPQSQPEPEEEKGGDEKSERQKRDKYGGVSWAVVREKLNAERNLTPEELAGLRASRRLRIEEAIEMGELELAAANLATRIRSQADRTNYALHIEESAAAIEREALADAEYRDNPWLRGVAGDAVRGTRFLAEADLAGRQLTAAERQERGIHWDPKLPWKQLIDFETDEQKGERLRKEAAAEAERQRRHERDLVEGQRRAAEAARAQYGGEDYMRKSRLEQAALARAAFLTVEKDGDNIYESIPLVPHGEIYLGLTQTEAETLAARMALSNARARVQQAVKTEQVFPASELMAISKASLEALSSMPGVSEATAIYAALITRPDLMGQYLSQMGLPAKNLLDIAEKTELKTYREAFAAYLGERFGLGVQDASSAEAVAYNFCKAFKVPESVDYRFYPEYRRTDRTRLSAVVNDTFRTLLNPAYKMLDSVEKVTVDANGGIKAEPKGKDRKGWPRNLLGNWIVRNIDGANQITKVWQKESLVGNAFCEVDFVDENNKSYKLMKAGDDGRMEGALIDAAVGLVSGQRDEFHIDWIHAENETPLFLYEFGKIKPAQLIVLMLETLALPKDTTVEQVMKAFGDLGTVRLNSRKILQLLIAHSERRYELHAHKANIELAVSGFEKSGYMRGFSMRYPDYFKVGLSKQN